MKRFYVRRPDGKSIVAVWAKTEQSAKMKLIREDGHRAAKIGGLIFEAYKIERV
jgi:hypothetical protein